MCIFIYFLVWENVIKESNVMKEYAGTYKLYNNEDTKTIFFKKNNKFPNIPIITALMSSKEATTYLPKWCWLSGNTAYD